ncbi:MAG: SWIM zinc finger family protein, partial [Nitrospinae bacterium]|nr:SWIM zinc finger family protein [Nitrospinota bacterium]
MLANILNRKILKHLAGVRAFERGADYFDGGRVVSIMTRDEKVAAKVRGAREYRVKLWEKDGQLDHDCTCPMGHEGDFCKHCVAAGLAWLAEDEPVGNTAKRRHAGADIRDYLRSQDRDVLADLVLQWAERDEALQRHLLLLMADAENDADTLKTFRKAIGQAVRAGGFVDYYEMPGYVDGLENIVASLARLLKKGRAATAVNLAEYAIERVGEALGETDDSDGCMGGILQRLQELHHAACVAAKPDPESLARRLFRLELEGEWDEFYGAAKTYRALLGKNGLKIYRELAEAEWKRIPELRPGAPDKDSWGKRFTITHIMEALAGLSGDVEELVAIKARDLSHAYNFLQIAEIYRKANQPDKALDWAERGLKAFPQHTDDRLRDFLAEEYFNRKRIDEAFGLIWAQFAESPHIETY